VLKSDQIIKSLGCFDILHVGHIRYLKEAKSLGDILIVGINSDRSARILKGPGQSIITEHEREFSVEKVSNLYKEKYCCA
jgi:cytidyltransferase-like protein